MSGRPAVTDFGPPKDGRRRLAAAFTGAWRRISHPSSRVPRDVNEEGWARRALAASPGRQAIPVTAVRPAGAAGPGTGHV